MNYTNQQIKQILTDQLSGFFKKKTGIEREVFKQIKKKKSIPHIKVLTGLRRSGKSTLLRQIASFLFKDKSFYYINFEDERFINFKATDFNQIYEVLVELYGEHKTFLIDEIQNISGFENFVRRFYENGFQFYITGSNAHLLSRELGTKLTGRYINIDVSPFSFTEFLSLSKIQLDAKSIYKTEFRAKIKKSFTFYLKHGGMPEYLIYKDAEILTRIYEDIIIKDIAVRYNIEHIHQLKQLYQYLVSNFALRYSFNTLKTIIQLGSVNTIKNYIDYLEQTYFATTVCKFDYSVKKQAVNERKFYIIDNGFISNISTRITKDNGWLLENLILQELKKTYTVFYFNQKYECDFIAIDSNKKTLCFQVTYDLTDQNKERELSGLIEAMNFFSLKTGYLITMDQEETITINKNTIQVIPAWKWLLNLEIQ